MFLRIIIFLALVATISLGINWMVENNGTVEFIWLGYQAKTSTAFIISALIVMVIALIIIIQLLTALLAFPKRLNRRYQGFQMDQNLKQLQIGYAALLSGDLEQAKKASLKLNEKPHEKKALTNLSEMLAAKVAQEEGNLTLAADYYGKFMDNKKQKFFAVKAMLDTSFQQGNIEDAIEYAEEAYALKPNVKDGARSLLELYKKSARYDKAEEFLRKYKRRYGIFKDRNNNIDVRKELALVWYLKAKQLLENEKSISINDKSEINQAKEYLEKAAKFEPHNKEILVELLKVYKRLKLEKRARDLIGRVWEKMQSYELGALYLDVFTANNYKEATKKKLKAIDDLKHASFNPEIIEKLRDKIYDVQIEY